MTDIREALGRFVRVPLAHLPTPLEPMPRLTAALGGPRLWIKRDDCTGLGLGGNKARKLEFVLAEALARGADTLVSGGVVQSNTQRQVAAAAAKLGLACHLAVYHGRLAPPSPEYVTSGNALLNHLFGAHLHEVPWTGDRNSAIEHLAADLRAEGRRPFVVPYGVSNGLGALGYTTAMIELAAQCAQGNVAPAAVVHASGSGATQAGLVLAGQELMPDARIVGIDINAEPERVQADVVRLARAASALVAADDPSDRVEVVAGHAGPAYGVPHDATLEAMRLGAVLEGLVLDPVYAGKALAGLIALVRAGRWRRGEDVIFVHTGGSPALFAYASALRLA
jgi:L-cysteate sulfo-lyase